MPGIRFRDRRFRGGVELSLGKTQTPAEGSMKVSLYLDGDERMAGKNFQGVEILRLGPAQTKDLSEVEEVEIILEDKVGEAIHRQGARMELIQKRMGVNSTPYGIGLAPELVAK